MSVVLPNLGHMYHPWRALRTLTNITLRWAHLPGNMMGYTDHETSEIVLDRRLNQVERRCTIAHELQHVIRGPVPPHMIEREEMEVDRVAARLLLPDIHLVAKALAWSNLEIAGAAEELWVDEDTLRTRLEHLHPSERGYLRSHLEAP